MQRLKKVIEPVKITCIDSEKGVFEIENRHDFTNLNEFLVEYRIVKDGEIIKNPNNWYGENLLGFLLMDVREALKKGECK